MCGPLGVTHLLLFSRSDSGNTNMRLAITPRGPTLHFRVENYSLCKDIMKAQRRPKNAKQLYMNAPLVCLPSFPPSFPIYPQFLTTHSVVASNEQLFHSTKTRRQNPSTRPKTPRIPRNHNVPIPNTTAKSPSHPSRLRQASPPPEPRTTDRSRQQRLHCHIEALHNLLKSNRHPETTKTLEPSRRWRKEGTKRQKSSQSRKTGRCITIPPRWRRRHGKLHIGL